MHITLETDYAIRIVDVLAKKERLSDNPRMNRLDAKTISETTDVPQRFALKILRKLVDGDIAKSYKGIYGGYELSKPLAEISLFDIVNLMEGTYKFSRCLDENYECTCGSAKTLPCIYRKAFGEISDEVCRRLKELTFDKLVK